MRISDERRANLRFAVERGRQNFGGCIPAVTDAEFVALDDDLRAERALSAKLAEALRKVEWSSYDETGYCKRASALCACCGAAQQRCEAHPGASGHYEECALALALADYDRERGAR